MSGWNEMSNEEWFVTSKQSRTSEAAHDMRAIREQRDTFLTGEKTQEAEERDLENWVKQFNGGLVDRHEDTW